MDNQKHTPYYYVDTQLGDRYCVMDGNDMSKQGAYRMLELLQENERKAEQIKKLEGLLKILAPYLPEGVGDESDYFDNVRAKIKAALNL